MGNDTSSSIEGSAEEKQSPPSTPNGGSGLGHHDDLNELCRKKDWESVIRLAHLSPLIYEKTIAAANTPLHTAISNHAPLEVVQALVFAYPPSVSYQNRFGNTALHFAVWKNRGEESLRVVQFLLDYYPQSAKMINNSCNLPLHWTANFKATMSIVQLVYRSYPQAIDLQNGKGLTPLQVARKRLGQKHPVVVMLQGDHSRNYAYDQSVHTAEATINEAEIWDNVDLRSG